MTFKVNCERCGALLIRGEVYNYRGKNLCEDCNILLSLFGQKAPDDFLSDELQLRRRSSAVVELRLSTKR